MPSWVRRVTRTTEAIALLAISQNWTGHMAEFITDYEAMVHAFQALTTHPRIYLMLSMVTHDTEGIPKAVLEQQVLPEVRQVGADTGSILVNYHDVFMWELLDEIQTTPQIWNPSILLGKVQKAQIFLTLPDVAAINGSQDTALLSQVKSLIASAQVMN